MATSTRKYYIRITGTWGIITTNIFISLNVLGDYTSHSLKCIRITWGIVKTETSDSFLEGFFVTEGQFHCDPHQNYCWCDTLAR